MDSGDTSEMALEIVQSRGPFTCKRKRSIVHGERSSLSMHSIRCQRNGVISTRGLLRVALWRRVDAG